MGRGAAKRLLLMSRIRRIHPPSSRKGRFSGRIIRYRNRTYHALRTGPTIIVVLYHDTVVIEKIAKGAATMAAENGSASAIETSAEHESLLSYLPRYRRAAFDPRTGRSFPSIASAPAAVLRSDIVGFTLLTDRMVKSGIAGAEQLADVMNQVINRMAEIAWAQGRRARQLGGRRRDVRLVRARRPVSG